MYVKLLFFNSLNFLSSRRSIWVQAEQMYISNILTGIYWPKQEQSWPQRVSAPPIVIYCLPFSQRRTLTHPCLLQRSGGLWTMKNQVAVYLSRVFWAPFWRSREKILLYTLLAQGTPEQAIVSSYLGKEKGELDRLDYILLKDSQGNKECPSIRQTIGPVPFLNILPHLRTGTLQPGIQTRSTRPYWITHIPCNQDRQPVSGTAPSCRPTLSFKHISTCRIQGLSWTT